uniref:Ras-related GTP-binding protein n=1 Tax=Knipowitschia caucasica TaxID=637954 RepID=A0AAV2JJ28_KNICA
MDSAAGLPYDEESMAIIHLNNTTVMYLKEVTKFLAMVCFLRKESFERKGLIDYNFHCFKKAIEEVFDVRLKPFELTNILNIRKAACIDGWLWTEGNNSVGHKTAETCRQTSLLWCPVQEAFTGFTGVQVTRPDNSALKHSSQLPLRNSSWWRSVSALHCCYIRQFDVRSPNPYCAVVCTPPCRIFQPVSPSHKLRCSLHKRGQKGAPWST